MNTNHVTSLVIVSLLTLMSQMAFAQTPNLDNVSVTQIDGLTIERAVFDSSRNLIYATVPSDGAPFPNGNSIAVIDPLTRDFSFVRGAGSDPNVIAISDDNSIVYFGVDGASGFRSFNPETLQFGAIQALEGADIVEDLAIRPGSPGTVIVAADAIGSSGSGDLQTFNENGLVSTASVFQRAESIEFLDSDTLVGFRNSSSGFTLTRFDVDDTSIVVEDSANGLLTGGGHNN